MIMSNISYRCADNTWLVVIRIDTSDVYDIIISGEVAMTAGQALDAAMSML